MRILCCTFTLFLAACSSGSPRVVPPAPTPTTTMTTTMTAMTAMTVAMCGGVGPAPSALEVEPAPIRTRDRIRDRVEKCRD